MAFVGFVALISTGLLMRYILPPGSGHYAAVLGLDRHEWGGIHFWTSVTLLVVLALHVILHWGWILCVVLGRTRERSRVRGGLGLLGVAALAAIAVVPLAAPVERTATPGDDDSAGSSSSLLSSHQYEDVAIQGSMTLAEVEATTGVPADYVLAALELPDSVSLDERLGRLRQRYGFEMSEVREIIRNHRKRED